MAVLAVAGAAAWGLGLRLSDPLSTSTLPAEDPYTHVALTREHLRDGSLEGLNAPEPYPPGLHAVLAVTAVHSGLALATLARFLPAAFGVIAIIGTAVLLRRLDGNAAAVVGALAVAVAPELVFRAQLFAPTALDLALLPFALLALVQTVRGRLGWAVPAALLLAFFVAAHPWVFGIVALAGAGFVVLALVFPWRDGPRLDAVGLAVGALLLGTSTALAISGCWDHCGPGFGVVEQDETQQYGTLALVILGSAVALAVPLLVWRRGAQRGLDRLTPLGPVARTIGSVALVAGALYLAYRAKQGGYPELVDPASMAGWPLILLAAAGLAAVPWARGPAAHAAAGLIAATLPFTLFDPFDSPFWPHRTAAYLALGLALSAGVAAATTARALVAMAAWSAPGRPAPWTRAIVPGLVVATVLGAGLVAAAPAPYPPWYRLHDECEDGALQDIARAAQADPDLVVATSTWQSKLVIAASADNASRIWYLPGLAADAGRMKELAAFSDSTDRPVLVVLDGRARAEAKGPAVDPQGAGWTNADTWPCARPVTTHLHTPT